MLCGGRLRAGRRCLETLGTNIQNGPGTDGSPGCQTESRCRSHIHLRPLFPDLHMKEQGLTSVLGLPHKPVTPGTTRAQCDAGRPQRDLPLQPTSFLARQSSPGLRQETKAPGRLRVTHQQGVWEGARAACPRGPLRVLPSRRKAQGSGAPVVGHQGPEWQETGVREGSATSRTGQREQPTPAGPVPRTTLPPPQLRDF